MLTEEQIELCNAFGPYSHGVWSGKNGSYGNEEALNGRGYFLFTTIKQIIEEKFSTAEIENLSIIDIGCYDGWLLCQLESLPFKKLVGLEPRKKNIDKGVAIREMLGIQTRCEFIEGSIENIPSTFNEKFDIVICTGLFHHLSSTSIGAKSLQSICKNFLFIETICTPSRYETDELQRDLELKDIPYIFGDKVFGFSGHKFESNYYDGSSSDLAVVSIPSPNALKMFLSVAGFSQIKIVSSPDKYKKIFGDSWRNFDAICITGEILESNTPHRTADSWILAYETGILTTLIKKNDLNRLINCHRKEEIDTTKFYDSASDTSPNMMGVKINDLPEDVQRLINSFNFEEEILKNIKYAPDDKLSFEIAKHQINCSELEAAKKTLLSIIRKHNSDWRIVYRSFCLVSLIFKHQNNHMDHDKYRRLCLLSNSGYPKRILDSTL